MANTKKMIVSILKLGCNKSKIQTKISKEKAIKFPFNITFPRLIDLKLERKYENRIIKKGFKNSEGCREKPKKSIHLVAPLLTWFCNKDNIIKRVLNIEPINEILIIPLLEKKEKMNSVIKDIIIKTICFFIK